MKIVCLFLLLTPLIRSFCFQSAVSILSRLPRVIQKKVYYIANLDKEMDFNVLPNSIWVGYRIRNETLISKRLPPDLYLSPIKIFPNSKPDKFVFFNFFQVNSTYLQGHRLEIVTVAHDPITNQKRFVILDYFSNTISSDPENLFKRSNSRNMNILSIKNLLCAYLDDKYVFVGEKNRSPNVRLSAEFALGCNHNIFYGSNTSHAPNYLTFNDNDVSNVRVFSDFNVMTNTSWEDAIYEKPVISFYYPHQVNFKIKTHKWWTEKESY